jgi:hypothetical protein
MGLIWKFLVFSAICAGGMVTCLVVNYFFFNTIVQLIGISFVIAGVGAMIWLVFKMKGMFSGRSSFEKTWRSYPKKP